MPITPASSTQTQTSTDLACPGCGAPAGPSGSSCLYCGRSLATLGCARCFGRLYAGMAFCPSCGAPNARIDAGVPTMLACPGCGGEKIVSPLDLVTMGSHRLHECAVCLGVWLDNEAYASFEVDGEARAAYSLSAATRDVRALGTSATESSRTAPRIRYRRCPACADIMARVNVAKISGVIVDRCRHHGTYFDVDELQRLMQFFEGGGVDRARVKEREALADERRRLAFMLELIQRQPSHEVRDVSHWP